MDPLPQATSHCDQSLHCDQIPKLNLYTYNTYKKIRLKTFISTLYLTNNVTNGLLLMNNGGICMSKLQT